MDERAHAGRVATYAAAVSHHLLGRHHVRSHPSRHPRPGAAIALAVLVALILALDVATLAAGQRVADRATADATGRAVAGSSPTPPAPPTPAAPPPPDLIRLPAVLGPLSSGLLRAPAAGEPRVTIDNLGVYSRDDADEARRIVDTFLREVYFRPDRFGGPDEPVLTSSDLAAIRDLVLPKVYRRVLRDARYQDRFHRAMAARYDAWVRAGKDPKAFDTEKVRPRIDWSYLRRFFVGAGDRTPSTYTPRRIDIFRAQGGRWQGDLTVTYRFRVRPAEGADVYEVSFGFVRQDDRLLVKDVDFFYE